jgi:hypothetical protein
MKAKHTIIGLALAIASASLFSSCKKKDKEEKDSDVNSAIDQSLASTTVNDMTSIADEAGKTYSVSSFRTADAEGLLSASCATVTLDTLAAAKTITVNFGATNCVCNDGRTRRGALVLSFTGHYRDSLTVITVTPQNYYVNDNQVNGSKTITNKGHNSAHHLVYEINANITIQKANNGGTITWQSNRQREWVSGESTLVWSDDMYSITGSASGTSSNGNTFTSNITTALVRNMAFGCRRNFVSGVLEHTPGGKATRYIDFGNGSCDNDATVTINGNTYSITLP